MLLIHEVRREVLTLSLLASLLLLRFSTFGRFGVGLAEACSLTDVVGCRGGIASFVGGGGEVMEAVV